MTRTYNFAIDTAVAPAHMKEVLEFIYKYYLLSKPKDFSVVNRINGSIHRTAVKELKEMIENF